MTFLIASLIGWVAVLLVALHYRGRFYATFAAVILGIHTFVTGALWWHTGAGWPLFAYLQAVTYVHFLALVWARLRPAWWRYVVVLPAMYFVGASFLALPWGVVAAAGFTPWAPWLPFAVGLFGVFESVWARETIVDVTLDGVDVGDARPRRWRRGHRKPNPPNGRPIRIVQVTDPHLGPWMSVRRLRRICARAVARRPDLIVLTGDLLTMDTNRAPRALAEALEPLRAMEGRVFACRGNHDLEAPETVAHGLREAGVRLLVDEAVVVRTPAGPVQVLGIDHHWRGRAAHLRRVCAEHPRVPGALRLVLLHDPGAFRRLPEGEGDLVLSGHTHGGQVGLVSLGLPWTMLRLFVDMPDHGLWARGPDRLYVHRGTGHYGYPLRVGVPAERSLLQVWWGADVSGSKKGD
ncbi:MAG: metallophosphoesterase [Myxococcota bacterium]